MRENADDKTIMLVEDDLDEQVLTLRALKKNGIGEKVVVAQDGVEALDRLLGTGEYADDIAPRLVLLDLKLPKVDGLEVLRRLRADERTMSLPVVVLTSSKGEQDMIDGYGSYADSCICRSVDFTQFSRAMRQLKPLLDGTEQTPAEKQMSAA